MYLWFIPHHPRVFYHISHFSTTSIFYLGEVLLSEWSFWPVNIRYGEGGFGCSPESRGRAVYATCLGDGEKTRWNRDDFLGVLDEQYLPDWAREKLEELRGPNQEPNCGPVADGFIMQ